MNNEDIGEKEIIIKKEDLKGKIPTGAKPEGSLLIVDTSKLYSEINKERIISARLGALQFGEIIVKKKHGKIYFVEEKRTIQFPINKKR